MTACLPYSLCRLSIWRAASCAGVAVCILIILWQAEQAEITKTRLEETKQFGLFTSEIKTSARTITVRDRRTSIAPVLCEMHYSPTAGACHLRLMFQVYSWAGLWKTPFLELQETLLSVPWLLLLSISKTQKLIQCNLRFNVGFNLHEQVWVYQNKRLSFKM